MPSGPKKRRAARRKRPGDADYDWEENEGIESAAAIHDGLVAKNTSDAAAVALDEPVDHIALSSNGGVDNVGSKDVNEGKKFIHAVVVGSSTGEDIGKEPYDQGVLGLGPFANNKRDDQHLKVKDRIKSSSIKVDDGLGFIAAIGLKSAQPVNNNNNNPSEEDNLELGVKGNVGKDKGKELHQVLESGPNNEASHKVEENDHTESPLIKEETDLVLKAATDIEIAGKPEDALSSKELTVVDSAHSDDVLQLDSKENVGKEFVDNFVDSSLEENTGKESREAVLDSGHNEADSHFIEGNGHIEFASIKDDDCLVPKAAAAIELAEPIDGLAVGVVVDTLNSQEILELSSKENEGKELLEDDAYSSVTEDRGNESPEQVPESDPNSETHPHMLKVNDHIESASIKADDNLVLEATDVVQVAEPINALSAKRVVVVNLGSEDALELSSRENAGKLIDDIVDSSLGEEKSCEEPQETALESLPNSKTDSQLTVVALELAEPNVDALSLGVVVDKDGPAEFFGLGTKENEGKDFPEDDVDSSLGEERARELPENVLNSDPNKETYSHLRVLLLVCIGLLLLVCLSSYTVSMVMWCGNQDDSFRLQLECARESVVAAFFIKPGSTAVELAALVGGLSSKRVVVDNARYEDVVAFGSKENQEEFLEDAAESSIVKDKGKEPPDKILDLGRNDEKDPYLMEGNDCVESAPIKDDDLALKAIAAFDLTDLDDALSSKGVDNIGSKDVHKFGSKENEGNNFLEDVADLSLGEDKFKEHPEEEEFVDWSLNNEMDPHLMEGNDSIESAMIKADAELALKAIGADDLTDLVDAFSSKDVDDVDNIGLKDVLEFGSKENEGNKFLKDVADSSPGEKKCKEHPEELLDSCLNNKIDPHLMEGNDHILSTKDGDGLVYKEDVELAELVDAISSKGVFVDIVGYRDVLELDPVENDQGEEFFEDAIDSSLWKVKAKELLEDVLDSGTNNKTDLHLRVVGDSLGSDSEDALELGSNKNEEKFLKDVTDSSLEEDMGKEPYEEILDSGSNYEAYPHLILSLESGEDLVCENATATTLVEPADTLSPEWVLVNHDDILDLDTKDCDGKEFIEDTVGLSLEEDECKEPPKKVCGTVLTENDDKPVLLEDPLNNKLELGSISKENDTTELAPADVETTSGTVLTELPKRVVQDAFIEDIYVRKHYQLDGEDILELLEAVRRTVEEQIVVVEDMRVNLGEMVAKLNSIRTKIRT